MITLNTNPGLLRTAVYERILSDLQQGAIAPGETISLNKLAETLNISKTPLRDALLELQAEGFVTLYPQRGECPLRRGEARDLRGVRRA